MKQATSERQLPLFKEVSGFFIESSAWGGCGEASMSGSQPGSALGRQQIASIMPTKSIFLARGRRPNINAALRRMKRGRR